MVVGSGKSIGDFASAARVIYQVIRAFDNLETAKKQYVESLAFLRGLAMVCDYLHSNKDNLGNGMEPHADTIWGHYEVLDKHLRKFVELTSKDASQFKKAFRTMKWAFAEMKERVKEMKHEAMDSVAFVETYVVFDIRDRIRNLQDSSDRQGDGIEAASESIEHIRSLTASFTQASKDNQVELQKISDGNDQQQENAQNLHKKIEQMEKNISASQQELVASLAQLTQHIEAQSRNASAEEVEQWDSLKDEVEEENVALEDLKLDQAKVSAGLADTTELMSSLAGVTGSRHLAVAGEKAGFAGRTFAVVGKFFPKSDSSKERAPQRSSNASSAPRPAQKTSARSALPLPDPSMAPPRRSPNAWKPGSEMPTGTRGNNPPEWGQRRIVILPPPSSNGLAQETSRLSNSVRQRTEVVEGPVPRPDLPPRPSSTSIVPSSTSTVRQWLDGIEPHIATPPPLPPRSKTSTSSTTVSMVHGCNPNITVPSPRSFEEILALIPEHQRPTLEMCRGIDKLQPSLPETLQPPSPSLSSSSPASSRLSFSSVSSRSSRGPKPIPAPKPNFAAQKKPGEVIETSGNTTGVSSVRQRAMELERTLNL